MLPCKAGPISVVVPGTSSVLQEKDFLGHRHMVQNVLLPKRTKIISQTYRACSHHMTYSLNLNKVILVFVDENYSNRTPPNH